MKAKKRADIEFGVDLDERVLELSDLRKTGINLLHEDGIDFLKDFPFKGDEVVYCDPPYYPSTRKQKRVYRYDLDEGDHSNFLDLVTNIKAKIIISGYDNKTYRNHLRNWNLYTYTAKAHDGLREECIWHNFTRPAQLHDYRYLGSNFRERQTIQRRIMRIKRRITELTDQERALLAKWLNSEESINAS